MFIDQVRAEHDAVITTSTVTLLNCAWEKVDTIYRHIKTGRIVLVDAERRELTGEMSVNQETGIRFIKRPKLTGRKICFS